MDIRQTVRFFPANEAVLSGSLAAIPNDPDDSVEAPCNKTAAENSISRSSECPVADHLAEYRTISDPLQRRMSGGRHLDEYRKGSDPLQRRATAETSYTNRVCIRIMYRMVPEAMEISIFFFQRKVAATTAIAIISGMP